MNFIINLLKKVRHAQQLIYLFALAKLVATSFFHVNILPKEWDAIELILNLVCVYLIKKGIFEYNPQEDMNLFSINTYVTLIQNLFKK